MNHENVENIARVCHETNRAYCETIGDNSQPDWKGAPDWQRQSAITGVKTHLERYAAGSRPDPADSHNIWLREKQQDGWKYGPVKDPQKKEHPCIRPYGELPLEQRMKDYLFAAIVEAYWKAGLEA